jgi:hypothetical protein
MFLMSLGFCSHTDDDEIIESSEVGWDIPPEISHPSHHMDLLEAERRAEAEGRELFDIDERTLDGFPS